jgi:hypothetical protein
MRARSRLLLDLVIACGLIAAYRPTWTGISLHEWVSIAIIVPLAVHLVVNWEWCVRIARTFLDRLFHTSRANFVVDVGLLIASVAVMLSGVMVSPIPAFFGAATTQFPVWAILHAWSANAIIALFALHAALHWKWIAATVKRMASEFRPLTVAPRRTPEPVRVSAATTVRATSPAQTRRAARLAAEKAAARRNAGVAGVITVSAVLGSLIFASVALAGPELARSLERQGAAVAGLAATRAAGKAAATRTASAAPGAVTGKTSAKVNAAATQAAPKAAAPKAPTPARTKLTCPRTGCTAYSCHGQYGQSPGTFYQTHN